MQAAGQSGKNPNPIRVLVVDDSAIVRRKLSEELSRYSDIQIIGSAIDPYIARDKIIRLRPDVITLDIEMPRMDGLSFLSKLMKHHPMPVIVVSSVAPENSPTALRALSLGAVEVISKPSSRFSTPEILQVVRAIRAAAQARILHTPQPEAIVPLTPDETPDPGLEECKRILAIGASTGGTMAIETLLKGLPVNTPPTLLVQHMPAGFTSSFAARLDSACAMRVREARQGDALETGLALLAPGDRHMLLVREGGGLRVLLRDGPPVHHQKPAVDVLFHSLARRAGSDAVGVILTGMGSDGAKGLLAIRESGGRTLAQDEASCVIFGMPRQAIQLGAVERVVSLDRMSTAVLETLAARSRPLPTAPPEPRLASW